MEKEYIDGIMVQYIKACLIKDIEMEQEYSKIIKEINIKDKLKIKSHMVYVKLFLIMETYIKELLIME